MGHQDSHLELRSLAFRDEALPAEPAGDSSDVDLTPLAIDHDAVPSWRETARFFRRAA